MELLKTMNQNMFIDHNNFYSISSHAGPGSVFIYNLRLIWKIAALSLFFIQKKQRSRELKALLEATQLCCITIAS